ncbi:unnamed protein product [[Actinomadura] parvosata subsp. kistnae]|nr:unnamed protein product [Actinomadura parvosata subsp. kistnae]
MIRTLPFDSSTRSNSIPSRCGNNTRRACAHVVDFDHHVLLLRPHGW